MATALSPSNNITTSTSRRFPPPCWSHDETTSLIQCYQQKWYSLRRGNLRATHWQEVADDVALRTPVDPTKTALQCRHKMEKLRKRYRSEIQRSAGLCYRFVSTWQHFQLMDDMEKGPNNVCNDSVVVVNKDKKNLMSDGDDGGYRRGFATPGVRIKIPGSGGRIALHARDVYSTGYKSRYGGSNVASGYGGGTSKVGRERFVGRNDNEVKKKRNKEVVESIRALGEGFMRMEKVKMDMERQVEKMRMEMELKRTEMVLESQQRIVEAFARAVPERSAKRAKKMSGAP